MTISKKEDTLLAQPKDSGTTRARKAKQLTVQEICDQIRSLCNSEVVYIEKVIAEIKLQRREKILKSQEQNEKELEELK